MEDFKKMQEALRVDRHPSDIEVWRRETRSESRYYSEPEKAFCDFEPLQVTKKTPIGKKALIEEIIQFQIQWRKYKSQSSTSKTGISASFVLREPQLVNSFLKKNMFLFPLLVEASREIKTYFPHSRLYLQLMSDPDGVDPDQLVLYISTDLPPKEARPKLKAFYREWWVDTLGRAQGKLCISLEYQ